MQLEKKIKSFEGDNIAYDTFRKHKLLLECKSLRKKPRNIHFVYIPSRTEKQKKKNYYTRNHLQTELKAAINQQNNTAPEEDTIHPQMIKKTTTRDTEVPARYVK